MDEQNLDELTKRIEKLEEAVFGKKITSLSVASKGTPALKRVDFSINVRAFVKRYAADKSGPKKFVILLSFFAKGEVNKEISFNEIRDSWNKMTGRDLMGGKFNYFFSNEAKNQGWVNAPKKGSYVLTDEWMDVLK